MHDYLTVADTLYDVIFSGYMNEVAKNIRYKEIFHFETFSFVNKMGESVIFLPEKKRNRYISPFYRL